MKRLTAALVLAAVCVASVVSAAQTGAVVGNTVAPHMTFDALKWRVHAAATVSPVDFMGGYTDSAVTTRLGATGAFPLDTTTALSTAGWFRSQQVLGTTDSVSTGCQFVVSDNGASSSGGADSIYVAAQASVDGINWFTLPTFKCGTPASITSRLDQANVTGCFFGALSLNGASQARGGQVWRVQYRKHAASCLDGVDTKNGLEDWPLLRFIVGFPDAFKYSVTCGVVHLTTGQDN